MKNKTNLPVILIVDDNNSNIDILIDVLKEFDIIPAIDGQTALNIISNEKIDLILLDIMMPKMDGFEVCKRLKNDKNTMNIPIIFLTAKYEMNDIAHGFKLGAVDYIVKPFNPIELLARINTQLELLSYQNDLKQKVKTEIEKNIIAQKLLFQKSKQAEIGELLMHIAHQWKQPLSELGSINMINTLNLTKNHVVSNDELLENFNKISEIIKFMSNTTETFQSFYKPDIKNIFFDAYSAINKAINLVSATFDYENIQLKVIMIKKSKIFGSENEYSQVILSILNNAKEIFKIREIKNPTVTIHVSTTNDNKSLVTINDNGGGIRFKNRNDVFLPFVSEKDGVGMGLYMSKIIINKNNGNISVNNTDNGVEFTIIM